MGKKFLLVVAAALLVGTLGVKNAHAIPVNITGYDILNADRPGTGGWNHFYTGTIVNLSGTLANYSGGTGTMADGVLAGTTHANSQLFLTNASQTITLFFDDYYYINTLDFYEGDHGTTGNSIPGAINGMDVTIGSTTQTFATIPFGPANSHTQNLINDRVALTGSGMDALLTNQLVITDVTAYEFHPSHRFSIAEIVIDGSSGQNQPQPGVVPEPATMILLGSGLLGMMGLRRKQS